MSKDKWIIGCAILIAVIIILYYKKIMAVIKNAVWDAVTESRIQKLHPAIREFARAFINAAEKQGIKLRVTDGYRTIAEQDKLYAQGRTTPGKIVTNAKGGQSYHNFGLAVDVVPVVNGNLDWNTTQWNKIATIGKSFGFEWGGDFKSIVDKPHFQMTFGNSLAQLRSKERSNGYVMV